MENSRDLIMMHADDDDEVIHLGRLRLLMIAVRLLWELPAWELTFWGTMCQDLLKALKCFETS